MHDFIHNSIDYIVVFINKIGYLGIFIGMFLESTIVPIPSEIIMIPAGIASAKGVMNIYIATLVGTIGNIAGAVFSYYLALTIVKIEVFFKKYGTISVFIGRLLPGFRHFISLPAGLAKMDFKLFLFYTSLGATIWTSILSFSGYLIGDNQELIIKYIKELSVAFIACCAFLLITAGFYKKIKIKKS